MSQSRSSPDWATARRLAFELAVPLDTETTTLPNAAGRTLAHDLRALTDVPHYDSSAMDGWVVAGPAPWQLSEGTGYLPLGHARDIVTGGLIPHGAGGVLRSENGVLHPEHDAGHSATAGPLAAAEQLAAAGQSATADVMLDLAATAAPGEPFAGQHIRPAGEEVRAGAVIIPSGTVLNPVHLAVAAMGGHDTLELLPRPRVRLLLSGNEVIEAGIPGPGFVRDVFGPQLPAFIGLLGGVVTGQQRVLDDHAETVAALTGVAVSPESADLVVTTGGTSNSAADHFRRALMTLGATVVVDGIRMRPGGPTFVARLPDGRYVACLPGNPLAALMGLLTVVAPLIAGLRGAALPALGTTIAGHDIAPAGASTRLLPYRATAGRATVSEWSSSGMLRGLADADGVLVCPPAGATAGDSVATIALPWPHSAR